MGELLLAYALLRILAAPAFPRDPDGFMPFQEHYLLWKCIGFAGIATFGTRFLVQWLYSERHGESKVPVIFWWQSLIGTVLCLAYFLRQQDSVGIAGYVLNILPYSRNLMLVYRKRRAEALAPVPDAAVAR
jgi:lipid-A-disaccharide synthase-like uncharacterized protein